MQGYQTPMLTCDLKQKLLDICLQAKFVTSNHVEHVEQCVNRNTDMLTDGWKVKPNS